jgi:predicted ABC-type ATPase
MEMTEVTKTLYLISGPMGAGKTAVSEQLVKQLPQAVMLDGGWCWAMDPFVVNDATKAMVMDNTALAERVYSSAGSGQHCVLLGDGRAGNY